MLRTLSSATLSKKDGTAESGANSREPFRVGRASERDGGVSWCSWMD